MASKMGPFPAIIIVILVLSVMMPAFYAKDSAKRDAEMDVNNVKVKLAEDYGVDSIDLEVRVDQQAVRHVRGQVNFGSGDVVIDDQFLAGKTKDGWEIAWKGSGVYFCQEVAEYGFPGEMIQDCVALPDTVIGTGEDSLADYPLLDKEDCEIRDGLTLALGEMECGTDLTAAGKVVTESGASVCCIPTLKNMKQTFATGSRGEAQAIVKELLVEETGIEGNVGIQVTHQDSSHIRGGFGLINKPVDGLFLATKIGEEWEIIWHGNGVIYCDYVEPYNFPTEMIQDCQRGNDIVGASPAVVSACEMAGGQIRLFEECDNTKAEVCVFTQEDYCYLDQLEDGECLGLFTPRVVCEQLRLH